MQSPDARLFAQAFQALNEGRLADAEQGFKKILKSHQRHPGALNLYSLLLLRSGRFEEAEPVLRKAISADPSSDVTFYNYGLTLKHLGKPLEALDAFGKSIAIKPGNPETWNNRGVVLKELGRTADAIRDFDQAIALAANYADAHANKGNALFADGRVADADASYSRAVAIRGDLAEAWIGKGNVLAASARHLEAVAAFEQATRLRPDLADAWVGCGTSLAAAGRTDNADAAFRNALAAHQAMLANAPRRIESWIGSAVALMLLKRYDDALAAYDKALTFNPRHVTAHSGRGGVYVVLRRWTDALKAYDQALRADPTSVEALVGRGDVLNQLQRPAEAAETFDKALAANPRFASAWLGRGNSLLQAMDFDGAVAAFETALGLRPGIAEAWLGIATTRLKQGRAQDALTAFEQAVRVRPSFAEAWSGAAETYMQANRHDDAVAAYKNAYDKRPDLELVKGQLAHAYGLICDWDAFEPMRQQCLADIDMGLPAVGPFVSLSLGTSAAQQLVCATTFARLAYPHVSAAPARRARDGNGRIRIAYLSADFHDHPVAQLSVGVFEHHDRSRFETIGLAIGLDDQSQIRQRIARAFDQFHDVRTASDSATAAKIAELGCDIVVDLTGPTQGGRTAVLAARPAPIQASWLGYAGTSGTSFMDYLIADGVVIPPELQSHFSEKVVTLPGCYLPNDSTRPIAATTPTRSDQGLPENGIVFCAFNNAYKITPPIFDRWMNLLRQTEGSVLWLSRMGDTARANLLKEAERRGVAGGRLVFATRVPLPDDHLARLGLADLFLDTTGYNAHATTCDALWAGVPVLTCMGETFAGRVAASALTAVGLGEMITTSLDDYEALALALVRDPARLAAIRSKLAANRGTHLLFDTARFARHLEAAYTAMHDRALRGEPPKAFAVDPL